MLQQLNGIFLYLTCGLIIAFVALVCIVFMVRAYRAGLAIGIDKQKLRRAVTSSMSFSLLPSVGILLGVIALSGSLGIPWPWLRLSVIGALHYETQVAEAAAEQVGMAQLSASLMTPEAFATIMFLMSICIMWGMLLNLFFNKRYSNKLKIRDGEAAKQGKGFADHAMAAMFIGLISTYIGSYIGSFVSGRGFLTFKGQLTPIIVTAASAVAMAFFSALAKRKGFHWLESFSIAGSMLVGMLLAVFI